MKNLFSACVRHFTVLHTPLPVGWDQRGSGRPHWVALYGETEAEAVDEFLKIFAHDFLLSANDVQWLHPGDKPLDIYRNYYKRRSDPDTLEWEVFIASLEKRYKKTWTANHIDGLTLATIYEFTRQ